MSQRFAVLIAAATMLGFVVRLVAAAILVGLDAPPKGDANPDQIDYELFAAQMAAGNGYAFGPEMPTACRPPGTSLTVLPVYAVFGRSFAAARVWFCLLGAATVALAGLTATRAFGPRAGVVAAFLLALYPGHFYYSLHFLGEMPFGFYLAGACLFGLSAATRPPGWTAAACGVCWAMTVLTRPNMAVGLAMVALLWLLSSGRLRERLLRVGLLGGAAVLVVAPWLARNYSLTGKPTVCTIVAGYTFWGAHNSRTAAEPKLVGYWLPCSELQDTDHPLVGSEVEREAAAWQYGLDWVRANLQQMPQLTLHKLLRVIWTYSETTNRLADLGFRAGWLALAPFVLLGAVWAVRRQPSTGLLLLTPFVATVLTAVVFYGCGRFRDGVAPVLVCFAGYGITEIVRRLRPGRA